MMRRRGLNASITNGYVPIYGAFFPQILIVSYRQNQCCQRAELKTSRARARLGLTKLSRDFGSPSRARAEPSLPLEVNEPSRAYIPQLGHKPSRAEPMSRLGSGLGEPGSAGSVKCKDKRTFNLPEVYGNRIPNYTSTQLLNLASTFCHHSFSHSSISILFSSVSEFSSSSFSSASFAAGCTSSDKSRRLLPGTNGVPLLLR